MSTSLLPLPADALVAAVVVVVADAPVTSGEVASAADTTAERLTGFNDAWKAPDWRPRRPARGAAALAALGITET
jgi:hypothetical protein